MRFGPMMGGGFGGPGMGMGGMGMPTGAPMIGYAQAFGGQPQSQFLGGIPGAIGGGIADWWGSMGPLDKGQVVGGALGGVSSFLQQRKENQQRDRVLDLNERAYDDEREDRRDRERRYMEWLAGRGAL